MDVKKLIDTVKRLYLKSDENHQFLKGLTEALDLASNKEWKEYVVSSDSSRANDYLNQSDIEKLKTDGRLLLEYDEKDITPELVNIAIEAHRPLTRSMCKVGKIKKHFTNAKLLKMHIICPWDKWLTLWNPKGDSLLEAVTKLPKVIYAGKDWTGKEIKHEVNMNLLLEKLDFKMSLMETSFKPRLVELKELAKKMKFPEELNELIDRIERFNTAYNDFDYSNAFYLDPNDNQTVISCLKLQGYPIEDIFEKVEGYNGKPEHKYIKIDWSELKDEILGILSNRLTLDELIDKYGKEK